MRIMLVFVGLLVVLGGLLPLLKQYLPSSLSFVPTEGVAYQVLIIFIGVAAIVYGSRRGRHIIKR